MLSNLKSRLKSYVGHAVAHAVSSAYRPMIYMGNNRGLTRTIYGHKMFVDTRDLSLGPHILLDGYWENWITKAFIQQVQSGMVVLDIGANIGYYSLLAANAVGSSGKVFCFEANPLVHEILFQNIEINGFMTRAQAINKAVFSETTTLEFNVCQKHQGSSSLFIDEKLVNVYNDNLERIKVEAVSLDEYFPSETRIDFIKIDAEGAEPHILKGASRLINENKNLQIMMEWAPALLDRPDFPLKDIHDYLINMGFVIYRIAHDSTLVRSSFEELSRIEHCDILLKRKG
jgi:FkbM family methyltransferase